MSRGGKCHQVAPGPGLAKPGSAAGAEAGDAGACGRGNPERAGLIRRRRREKTRFMAFPDTAGGGRMPRLAGLWWAGGGIGLLVCWVALAALGSAVVVDRTGEVARARIVDSQQS